MDVNGGITRCRRLNAELIARGQKKKDDSQKRQLRLQFGHTVKRHDFAASLSAAPPADILIAQNIPTTVHFKENITHVR